MKCHVFVPQFLLWPIWYLFFPASHVWIVLFLLHNFVYPLWILSFNLLLFFFVVSALSLVLSISREKEGEKKKYPLFLWRCCKRAPAPIISLFFINSGPFQRLVLIPWNLLVSIRFSGSHYGSVHSGWRWAECTATQLNGSDCLCASIIVRSCDPGVFVWPGAIVHPPRHPGFTISVTQVSFSLCWRLLLFL